MRGLGITAACIALLLLASSAMANPTIVTYTDGPQDPLIVPQHVEELGWMPPFPTDEWITSFDVTTDQTACFDGNDNLLLPNREVTMTNMTGRDWKDVWYVKDPETMITNFDGWVNGQEAFKIDSVGINIPLIAESIAFDGVFAVGETWVFIIQDYVNVTGGPASAFDSIGVPTAGFPPSTGSIIAVVPEPATLTLLALGAATLLKRRF